MGIGLQLRSRLLKVFFVLAACFALGLVTSGVVAGAGPLAALSSSPETDTTTTTTETTDSASTDTTETTGSDTTGTESTETTGTESTETTETETTETTPDPLPLTGVPCPELGTEALATDHSSYPPGSVATISGTGFTGSCDVLLRVTRPDAVVETATVATDADGALTHPYDVPPPPGVLGIYEVKALGLDGAVLATISFNDGPEINDPDISPGWVAGSGARAFSILVRNTGDTTHRCVRVTLPSGYSAISATGTAGSSGGTFGSSVSGTAITFTNSTGFAPGGWGRFDIQATSPASNNTTDWQLRAWSNTGCSSDPTSIESVQVVSGTQPAPRRYTAAFVGTPNFATGASITMTKLSDSESNTIQYFSIALPRCFTGITVTNHGTNNGSPWAATVVDNFLRWRDTSSGNLDDNQSVMVNFTANTSGCAAGTYTFWSTGWEDETGSSDADSKLFTTSVHATAVIGAANTPPTASPVSTATNEDTPVIVTLSGSDVQTCDLTFAIVTPSVNGGLSAVTDNACAPGTPNTDSATVIFTPSPNFNGPTSFTYRVTDGGGLNSPAATVNVTVNPVDDPGTAVNDTATVGEDSGANTINVLANDTDPDGGSTVTAVTQPANGTVVNNGSNVSYTPKPNYCNTGGPTDDFTYTITGGSTASVAVRVTCVDDNPTAVGDSATVAEDASATAIDVLANDTDPDGGPKSIGSTSDPLHGTVVITGGGTGLTYEPDPDYCNVAPTTDDFTYTLNGGSTATVKVTVTCVDDDPTAVNDSATVVEDSGANTIDVLANDTDPDGGPKTIQSTSDPAHGTVAITGGGTGLTYTPDANYCNDGSSPDDFTYTLNGGSSATVEVEVTCVDDPPVVAFTGGATTRNEGQSDTYTFSITDPDSTSFTYETGYPKCGTGGMPVGSPTLGSSGGSFECSFPDGPANPTVAVKVRDATSASNEATRDVDVDNLPPEISAVAANSPIDEGGSSTVTVTASDPAGAHDPLSYEFDCNGDSTFEVGPQPGNSHSCDYPDDGTFTVGVRVTDGDGGSDTGSTTVQVRNVPPAVTAAADQTASEGTGATFSLGSFADPGDDDPWEVTVDWGDGTGDTVFTEPVPGTITPKSHTYADDGTFTVTVSVREDSGTGATGSDTFQVAVANVPPAATAPADKTASEGTSASFSLGSFADPGDDDPWEVTVDWGDGTGDTVFTEPAPGTITPKSHTYADDGLYTVTVAVKEDNGAGAGGSATFRVAVANVPPGVAAPPDQTASEGTGKTFDLGYFTDPGADSPWRVTVNWGDATADTVFTETSPGAIADQPHTYVDSGLYTVTITVEEENGAGPGSGTDTFQVSVANVPPAVAKPTFDPAQVGCRASTTLKNISFSDPGVEDDPWTVDIDWGDGLHDVYTTSTQGPQPDRTHTYAVANTYTATVTVTDEDGGSGSNTSTTTVTVFRYSVEFRPPVDGSSAAGVVVNKMKNGRVVPVKVQIHDLCAGADLTDPNANVTIRVTKSSGTSGAGDPVEEYADAGNSSGGTDEFRWSSPHWIYNLDSKALGFVVGNKYRVDVYVNNVRATIATWAILEPVK